MPMSPRAKKPTSRAKRPVAPAGLRSRLGDRSTAAKGPIEVSSTEAQNNFGLLLDQVVRDRPVFIRRRQHREAVMISIEQYEELTRARESPLLDTLTAEFDALLERMQSAEARRAAESLFSATPEELGQAAVGAARHAPR
jgi:prevent-host-death family protein